MVRFALCIVLLMRAGHLATCQDISSQLLPKIRVNLSPEVPSESVHINYFMTGQFGGHLTGSGGYVTAKKGQSYYEITAAVNGKTADRVKLISYAPGCQIETLDIQIQSQIVSQQLLCTPLSQKILYGQITPASIPQQPSEIEVTYLAMWDRQFFGLIDGPPFTTIRVALGSPDQNGYFVVRLPDFNAQANLGEGEFQFTLRESKTGYIIAFLNPAGDARGRLGLKVQASYPSLIRFSSTPPPQLNLR